MSPRTSSGETSQKLPLLGPVAGSVDRARGSAGQDDIAMSRKLLEALNSLIVHHPQHGVSISEKP